MTNDVFTQEEIKAALQQDFTSFIEFAFYELNPDTRLMMSWYIEVMTAKLEECRKGNIKRLIINLPPRYLKSHCASVAFVAWLLGHNPATQIICASYGQDLSEKLARDCRNIIQSKWYKMIFGTRLHPDKTAVNDFMTTRKGFRMATSVGGVLTGRGADFIIIDDPMKPDEALSETRRKNVNEWFDHSLLSRLNSKIDGCIIIIMQRLHQDDLVGHVMEQNGWEVVSFPAIAEQDENHIIHTPLGTYHFKRKEGEALHPERESLQTLANMRQSIGEYAFASQYQQTPAPQGGAMVKKEWLKYYEPGEQHAKFDRIVQSWDTANKAGELNDYSVCTTWGKKDKSFYLLHVFRRKMEYPDLKRAVKEQAQLFKANKILIEDKASGTQLLQELKSEGLYSVTPYEPQACEKIIRFNGQTDAFENGRVFLPKEAHWLQDYIHEITTFPGSKHDDQVDSTTQALAWMRTPVAGTGIIEYYRQLVQKQGIPLVRMRFPANQKIQAISTIAGRTFNRWQNEIIDVTQREEEYLYQLGFTRVG